MPTYRYRGARTFGREESDANGIDAKFERAVRAGMYPYIDPVGIALLPELLYADLIYWLPG